MNNIKIQTFNLIFFCYLGNKAWLNLNLLPARLSEKYKVLRITFEDFINYTLEIITSRDVLPLTLALPGLVSVLLFPVRPCVVQF